MKRFLSPVFKRVSEVSSGPQNTVMTSRPRNSAEILIIADGIAGNLMLDSATVFTLQLQEGFREVSILIQEGKLSVSRFNVIVLLLGRADLWELDRDFKRHVQICIDSIKNANVFATLVLTATLPSPGDTMKVVRTANYRNGHLSQMAPRGREVGVLTSRETAVGTARTATGLL